MFSKRLIYEAKHNIKLDSQICIENEYSFGRDEELRCWFGRKSFSKDTLSAPTGIAIQSDNRDILYVCDPYRIQVFHLSGYYITSIVPDYIVSPWGIIVQSDAILVTDIQLCALLVVTEHNCIKMGGAGVGQCDFISPRGMACDGQGNIYIADAAAQRIRVFTSGLNYLKTIGRGKIDSPIDVNIIDDSLFILLKDNQCVLIYSLIGIRQREIRINSKPSEKFTFFACVNFSLFILTTYNGHNFIIHDLDGKVLKRSSPPLSQGILYLPYQQRLVVASQNGKYKIDILKFPLNTI